MSDSSRSSKGEPRGGASRGLPSRSRGSSVSPVRTVLAALLVVAGIAWMVAYLNFAQDVTQGGQALSWMAGLGRWNFMIGFGVLLLGLAVAAHPSTPLGRGRGVVAGMLGCFLLGLVWIVVYYMAGNAPIPVIRNLDQYNLIVGIGFMAVGFVYATHWE